MSFDEKQQCRQDSQDRNYNHHLRQSQSLIGCPGFALRTREVHDKSKSLPRADVILPDITASARAKRIISTPFSVKFTPTTNHANYLSEVLAKRVLNGWLCGGIRSHFHQ